MRYVKNDIPGQSRNNLIVFAVILLVSLLVPIANPSSLSAQTSEIRATVEDPTAALSVSSVNYQLVSNRYNAQITVRIKFVDTIRVYMNGNLIDTKFVANSGEWVEYTFDILLPDDQVHEIVFQGSNSMTSVIAEESVQAKYVEPDPEPGPDPAPTPTPGPQPDPNDNSHNPWWPLPPNTGELLTDSPQNILVLLAGVFGVGFVIFVIRRKKESKKS